MKTEQEIREKLKQICEKLQSEKVEDYHHFNEVNIACAELLQWVLDEIEE